MVTLLFFVSLYNHHLYSNEEEQQRETNTMKRHKLFYVSWEITSQLYRLTKPVWYAAKSWAQTNHKPTDSKHEVKGFFELVWFWYVGEGPGDFDYVLQIDDSSIWSKLPEDLLDEILARVSPFTIIRLRSVCKRWNSFIQDPSFINRQSKVSSHHLPCLLTIGDNTGQISVFTLPLKRWFKIPFDFFPLWNDFDFVGSSGGLVCFSGWRRRVNNFEALVCNPLTQTWRILPRMHNNNRRRELIFVADSLNRSFKVIAPGKESLRTEVYDSKTDQWSLHHIMIKPNFSEIGYCDSRLYTKSLSPGLMMYRIDSGEWEHLTSNFPLCSLKYLVSGARRLFLVTKGIISIKIWEFDYAEVYWVEIGRMPRKYLKGLLKDVSVGRFECCGQDNFICFTSRRQGKGKALLYEVDRKIWSWINGFEAREPCNMCFYEPRFDACVK